MSSQGKCVDEIHSEITNEEANLVENDFQKIIGVMNFNYEVEYEATPEEPDIEDIFDSIDDFI